VRIAVNVNGYNRPGHLKKTLEAISLSECTYDVYIDLDGPRSSFDRDACSLCLGVANDFALSYPYTCYVSKSVVNNGLASSILCSIESRLSKYDFAIFLEDDIVVTSAFFHFMEASAKKYKNNSRVMQVSGFNHSHRATDTVMSFFLPFTTSWGWGTWPRAWNCYDRGVNGWLEYFKPLFRRVIFDLGCGFYEQVLANHTGKKLTWAIFWYASVFREKGLVLYPSSSLISNIGHDGSGENCKPSKAYDAHLKSSEIGNILLPDDLKICLIPLIKFVFGNWLTRARGLMGRVLLGLKERN